MAWGQHDARRQKLAADPKWQAAAEERRQAVMARVLGAPKPSEVNLQLEAAFFILLAFSRRPIGRPQRCGTLTNSPPAQQKAVVRLAHRHQAGLGMHSPVARSPPLRLRLAYCCG